MGDEEGVKDFIDKDTEEIRYDDGIILPGFGEGHGHITPGGTEALFFVHLNPMSTLEEHLAAIKEFIRERPELDAKSHKKIDNLEHPLEFNGEINDNRNSGFPIEGLIACENGNTCKNSVYCFGYRVYLSKMKGAWNESRQDHQKRENIHI